MKTTKKEINANVIVKRSNGFKPFYNFKFYLGKYKIEKPFEFDEAFVLTNDKNHWEYCDGQFSCKTKKEFVNGIYEYLKSL